MNQLLYCGMFKTHIRNGKCQQTSTNEALLASRIVWESVTNRAEDEGGQ